MRYLRLFYKIFIFLFILLVIIIIGLYTSAYFSTPIKLNNQNSFYLYDSENNFVNMNNNDWITIDNISNDLINAVISVEDKNFYKHNGFDYSRIVKAMFNNIKNKKIVEGASTISQQFIKNEYLDFKQTWSRKIDEAIKTINLETHYSKDEILEAYLNSINYGQGNYGIYQASMYYFNLMPSQLSLEQAIMLSGIPKNPSNYNPVTNYENCIKRAKVVALLMLNNGYIDKKTYKSLFKEKIEIYAQYPDTNLKTLKYYEQGVLEELKSIEGITDEIISSGKLRVYTSLNISDQTNLENNINTYLTDDNLQVSSILVNPNDGAITALVGGKDYSKSEYNRALFSKRQVGSTMKSFLYYSALENGMTSASTFLSQPTTFNLDNNKTYSPNNWANIYANKEITMASAIAYSDNIYAVKTNLFLGTDKMINTAKLTGIKTNLKNVASLPLGTTEINMVDYATGYCTFASGGYKKELHFINKIEDTKGNVLYEYKNINNLVLNPSYVYILNELLTSTTNAAFTDYNTPTAISIASKMSQKYAFKTGTTDTDYWAVGYNKNAMLIIWSGYDDNKNIEVSIGSKIKNIWVDTIENASINKENSWYDMPENVIGLPLNAITGEKTSDESKTNIFYFIKGSEIQ